jgi:hypothetical protein
MEEVLTLGALLTTLIRDTPNWPRLGIYLRPRAVLCVLMSLAFFGASAQEPARTSTLTEDINGDVQSAPVVIDGDTLFRVRGVFRPFRPRSERRGLQSVFGL